MREDFEMGANIAKTHGKTMTVRSLVAAIEQVIDWNRFDYEAGETDLHEAILVATHGFTSAGGVIDYTHAMEDSET